MPEIWIRLCFRLGVILDYEQLGRSLWMTRMPVLASIAGFSRPVQRAYADGAPFGSMRLYAIKASA